MHKAVFSDYDGFSESVGDADMVMMMCSPRKQVWRLSMVDLPGVHVQHGYLGSGNIVEGKSLEDGYLAYLPLSNFEAHTANGAAFGQNSFMVLRPSIEFDLSIKDEHEWCSVFIPNHLLPGNGELQTPEQSNDPAENIVIHSNNNVALQFKATITSIISSATFRNFETSLAAENAATQIRLLVESLNPGGNHEPKNSAGRPSRHSKRDVIRRCKKFLEENDEQPVRLSDLVNASQVSQRTLQNVFCAYFGVPPTRFLQLRQFHRIRRELKIADVESDSVTDILLRNGVWEFGRFASRYRTLFGEPPSTTLKTKNRFR